MKSLSFGFIGILVVVFFSVEGSFSTYLQKHSLILVLGGSFVLLFLTTPGTVFSRLWKSCKDLVQTEESFDDYKEELEQLARTRSIAAESKNPMIRYATELWEQGVDANLFVTLMSQKRMEMENESIDAVQVLKNLAKYPPALGMTGTVMGMIALFADLDGNKSNIGQNLALAMTATFFGLIVTNVFLSPIADRMHVRHVNRKRLCQNIYQILLLINQNEPHQLISDEMEGRVA